MSYLRTVDEPDARGAVADIYTKDREAMGHLPNYTRTFSHRPDVYAAWKLLNGTLKAEMDLRRYELATVAVARRLRSSYCALAHGKVLAELLDDEDAVRSVVDESPGADLDPVDRAVVRFADKVAADAAGITAADVDELRAHGLDDREIFDVVLAAAARCFFSTVLEATGTEPDAVFAALSPALRDSLTVGRPIATPSG